MCQPFACPLQVKITGITIKGPDDGSGPRLVKLFTNRNTMGFSDTDSTPAQVGGWLHTLATYVWRFIVYCEVL